MNALAEMEGKSPWDVLWAGLNIYRIDIESNEQGSDYEDAGPPTGTLKDTYLNTSFWTRDIERLLSLDLLGSILANAAATTYLGAGNWDLIIVLVNSTKYGGAGGGISVASVHSGGPEILTHEIGHSHGDLADEYHYFDGARYFGLNPIRPNVDISATAPKCSVWIEGGTPLPTPDNSTYESVVGTFEGAFYKQYGIYRPWRNCRMRVLGNEFCPVCKEAHLLEFFDLVQLTDFETPATGSVVDVESSTNLMLGTLPILGMTNRWELNGQPIGSGGSTLVVTTAELPLPTNTVSAITTFQSMDVRSRVVEQTNSWTVAGRG